MFASNMAFYVGTSLVRGAVETISASGDPQLVARILPDGTRKRARLFSGLVSAYQSTDPAVMSDDGDGTHGLTLEDLHAVVDGAFGRV